MSERVAHTLEESVFQLDHDSVMGEIIDAMIERDDGVDNFGSADRESVVRGIKFAVSVDGGKLSENKGFSSRLLFYSNSKTANNILQFMY